MLDIIIDYRESKKAIEFLKRLGFDITIEKLTVADYIVGNVFVERKTIDEAIFDMKHLLEQLKQMEQLERKILLLAGELPRLEHLFRRRSRRIIFCR